MKILITGGGSVMGQSIYRALAQHPFREPAEAHIGNSDELGAALYFNARTFPVVGRVILPLARDSAYFETVAEYARKKDIDIVFAGTQHELSKLARLPEEGVRCAILPPGLTDLLLDKARTMDVLSRRGVRVPRTQSFAKFRALPSFQGPGIIKPNTSSASRNLHFFESAADIPQDAAAACQYKDYIAQERLCGDEFTCGCYIDRYSGQMSLICLRRRLTLDGATGYGEVVHDPELDAYVRTVAVALGAEGFKFGHINVQLIIDNDGPCLFEVNGRLSSTEAPKARLGFNSSAAYVVNLVEEAEYKGFAVAHAGRFLRYYEEVFWT